MAGLATRNPQLPVTTTSATTSISRSFIPATRRSLVWRRKRCKSRAIVEHILLLTGDIDAPTITVWDSDVRDFEDTDTVFEVRFGHANAFLGDIDIYFDPPDTVPGTNPPVATFSFGRLPSPADFDQGPYVMTVTAAGDPDTVYFIS